MNAERADFPFPPHHYKQFDKPGALQPPNLKEIAKQNKVFYAFGAEEPFFDRGEKITPYYLENKEVLLK